MSPFWWWAIILLKHQFRTLRCLNRILAFTSQKVEFNFISFSVQQNLNISAVSSHQDKWGKCYMHNAQCAQFENVLNTQYTQCALHRCRYFARAVEQAFINIFMRGLWIWAWAETSLSRYHEIDTIHVSYDGTRVHVTWIYSVVCLLYMQFSFWMMLLGFYLWAHWA